MREFNVFKNKTFRVILGASSPHPRPHLIMLYNGKRNTYNNIYDFDYQTFLIWIDTIHQSFKELPSSIFSIHLGYYQSKESPHFHAHYYIPIINYMEMIATKPIKIDFWIKLSHWPRKIFNEGEKYKTLDLKSITKLKISKDEKPLPKLTFNYSYIFHSTQPRIAFIHNEKTQQSEDHQSLAHLVLAMMEFVDYYGLNNRKIGGCHLCIQNGISIDNEFKDVDGYLQIDLVNYYKINPQRKSWLKKFKESSYEVLT